MHWKCKVCKNEFPISEETKSLFPELHGRLIAVEICAGCSQKNLQKAVDECQNTARLNEVKDWLDV